MKVEIEDESLVLIPEDAADVRELSVLGPFQEGAWKGWFVPTSRSPVYGMDITAVRGGRIKIGLRSVGEQAGNE